MTDVVDRKTRSRMMAGIKGKDTAPELTVRRYLHAVGLRFRLHDARLPGRPDIALPRQKVAVFIHGCFWHRHAGCPLATVPATRPEFWQQKFEANQQRDRRNVESLLQMGWKPIVVWECMLQEPTTFDDLFWQIVACEATEPVSAGPRGSKHNTQPRAGH